ncbi:hypothetical protein [Variovorax paradoxus]|uniref:hypothetical protein n=1 Tax=Variovorax paradoxus TaxID=34073 RepID=UPI0019328311|nr:hypothetical protein INQ48_13650 [Variovorax paradoxus]
MNDTFRGDNAALIKSIDSLLRLDAAGALVPHGVGGLARQLLAAAASRLAATPAVPFCAPDGTCSCQKFADDPAACERRFEAAAQLAPGEAAPDLLQDLHNELYRAQTTDSVDVLTRSIGKARLLLSLYRDSLAQPAPVPKWIDDPHDIEQGQMLNPAWLKLHGLSEAEAANQLAPVQRNDAGDLAALNDDLIAILGRPNFTCIRLAQALRLCGTDIKTKAEHEQAAVIHFLLMRYLSHGSEWAKHAEADLRAMLDQVKAKNKAALESDPAATAGDTKGAAQ